ncbi:MAG: hypothetical protein JWQ68_1526 [Cryobacterium sp.]|jgi:hypothetical protein|nr:hypothetical protein [Cryobacterium sp.]
MGEPTDVPRQEVVKAAGRARRARLTSAPGSDPNPETPVVREEGGAASGGIDHQGENDARLKQDRPPHW